MKKLNKLKLPLIVFSLFLSCSQSNKKPTSLVGRLVEEVKCNVTKTLLQKYPLIASGESTAMPQGIINNMGLIFRIRKPLTIYQARPILIDCVETFLKEVNTNIEIRKHLRDYPFTQEHIQITLIICESDGSEVFDPQIDSAVAAHNKIWYTSTDKNNTYEYKAKYKEPYEEALRLVNQAPLPLKNSDS